MSWSGRLPLRLPFRSSRSSPMSSSRRARSGAHLAETVLPSYVANSLLLVLGVGIGVLIIRRAGRLDGDLVPLSRAARCSIGRCCCRWRCRPMSSPIPIPACWIMPARRRRRLRDLLGLQGGLRWIPDIRSLPGAIVDAGAGALSLCLSAGARGFPGAIGLRAGSQPHAWLFALARFLARGPAARRARPWLRALHCR